MIKISDKTKTWLKAAGVRAIKTMAQSGIAMIGTAAVMQEVNWLMVASSVAVSGILSILTSVKGLPEVDTAVAATETVSTAEAAVTEEEVEAVEEEAE